MTSLIHSYPLSWSLHVSLSAALRQLRARDTVRSLYLRLGRRDHPRLLIPVELVLSDLALEHLVDIVARGHYPLALELGAARQRIRRAPRIQERMARLGAHPIVDPRVHVQVPV
eukprot:CAMPEP_0206282808 /NCGR_PEP_ID=MMETSP0047_2-20121206/39888_1 /ASSEMBLY_ACC=CAM_ASM_000192 /TAXON_ID=195065 /ORGANISM="Chroomonas mesostigmatica_cf, Strain CCMP1168" /LENGTH=113 /DNA_ID=CAMNT_0053713119 /DNA_START=124 /DNA_END=462 /DNA_ORIENTATION=+